MTLVGMKSSFSQPKKLLAQTQDLDRLAS